MNVNSIEQMSRDSLLILCHQRMGTGTGLLCIPIESTRAGGHRRDELKVSRELERSHPATDCDNHAQAMITIRSVLQASSLVDHPIY